MKKEMLINVLQPEEIRIAILEDGVLEELYVERTSHESYVGNIYKGRIVNIEPSIQAAFVDFGVGRNGFLHVSDVEPAYYRHLEQGKDFGTSRGRDRGRGEGRGGRPDGRGAGPGDRGRGDRGGRGERGERGGRGGSGRSRRSEPRRDYSEMMEELEDAVLETPADLPAGTEPAEDFANEEVGLERFVRDDVGADPGREEVYEDDASGEEGQHLSEAPAEEESASAPTSEDVPAAEAELAPSAETSENDDPPAKGRRRGRGRGRGRKPRDKKPASSVEPGQDAPAGPAEEKPEKSQEDAAQDPGAPPREWPRLMESAERRTEEGDEPADSVEPRKQITDEELSFSMRPPEHRSAPPRHEPPSYEDPDDEEETPELPSHYREEPPPVPGGSLDDPTDDLRDDPVGETSYARESPAGEQESLVEERAFMDEQEEVVPSFPDDEGYQQRRPSRRDDRRDAPRGERGDDRRGGRRDDRRGGGRRDEGRRDEGRGGPRRGPAGRMGLGRPKPLIQDIFKRGQEVLVQVIKEGIGTKGPTLSTYISIAGRYLVLMPGLNRIGVSRKIIDEDARRRLRDILGELEPPRGIGFIIRTAGLDRNKKELQRDLAYLSRLWQVVVRRIKKTKSPCEIYQESDMITRTIRDIFTGEIDTIWVDQQNAYEHAKEFLQIVMPRYASHIKFYDSTEPMFHRHGIENEIARIEQRHVPLPAGGSIVIDQTEALVAIDVNSGNFRADNNAEETAYQMNLHAAREIARQLRLRDLGGVIVNDFIDMRDERHRRNVEKALRDAVMRDRARTKILRISQFGIIEMTRQRIRPSLKRSVYQDCAHCRGTGQIKTCESMSIDVMRLMQLAAHREQVQRIEVKVHDDVANFLQNRKRQEVAQIEQSGNKQVNIRGIPAVSPEFMEFVCYDNINNEVKFMPLDETPPPRQSRGRR